jgi:hypothetical protein
MINTIKPHEWQGAWSCAPMEGWIHRQIETRLMQLAATRPVVVLTGARQTGKTALCRHLFWRGAAFPNCGAGLRSPPASSTALTCPPT